MNLSAAQVDRAVGALLGSAIGDALGAGYEFDRVRLAPGEQADMIGGGLADFAPGEWTDDTSMAIPIARVAATGADLRTDEALDAIAAGFAEWYAGHPKDVGIQTSQVLALAGRRATAASMTAAASSVHDRTGRSGGNGSLMRTAPVALAHLDDPVALVEAAKRVSALTHTDPHAGEACALWCLAIRHTVLEGRFPGKGEFRWIASQVSDAPMFWIERLHEAVDGPPSRFNPNGYVIHALQAAWSSIWHTIVPSGERQPCEHFADSLDTAIRIGNDTDTVAAIAGALLGARWGGSAIPSRWRTQLHGWPGLREADLVRFATASVRGGSWVSSPRVSYDHCPGHDALVAHPLDDGVLIGGASGVDALPDSVTAVVSLCRMGTEQVPVGLHHETFRLIDSDRADNPNLEFVIDDAARAVKRLRDEGHVVLLHCVAAQSRTPTVAARYGVLLGASVDDALKQVVAVLPTMGPKAALVDGLRQLGAD
ncbi:ADP-ribosylglycohydrolase family protein [Nocardioides sp. JQ2195]|uniref:ADP-ribosylglycohydrolase family protein n=1 Tax=Nocardioides sp. JQ2195 TaxID=2592334 RepID=UPI00143E58A6|nr:ADP-ribosylglycohydrolase family protein [Nocardioides sp. JQ2195]QIX27939.1 ADP-ribosylglycohydrolase family protein [Nocardioides sp. JQ2195]